MLHLLRRFLHPLAHSADDRQIKGGTLVVIHFAGSANRDRAARYVEDVLRQAATRDVDGMVIDFSDVHYMFGNNGTFTALHNFLVFEKRFVRIVPGNQCESGMAVLARLHSNRMAATVEDAVCAFAIERVG